MSSRTCHASRARGTLIPMLIAAAFSAGPARGADNMDRALASHAPQVIRYLHDHHVRNTGVLKFRVQKGKQPVSFRVGPLNANMAERLEAALVLANTVHPAIGIAHDPDHVAVAKKLASYTNPAGRRGLFQQKYPLAWDGPPITPDLFLTGLVTVSHDLKQATVTVEAIHPTSMKEEKVVSFTVATDRSLLNDLNESFQVASRQLKRRTRTVELDEDAVSDAGALNDGSKTINDESQPGSGPGNGTPPPPPPPDALLSYDVLYDGVPQPVGTDPASPGELQVTEPAEGQQIAVHIRSLAQERLGLVLMVNGVSTLYEQKDEPSRCAAWVLDPGRDYLIRGYQVDNQTFKPFRVLSAADSEAVSYNDNNGLIQFHVFREGGNPVAPAENPEAVDESRSVSLRGINRAALKKGQHTRSLAELQKAMKGQSRHRLKRGLIDPDSSAVDGAISNDEVKNPVHVQTIVVRYRKRAGS